VVISDSLSMQSIVRSQLSGHLGLEGIFGWNILRYPPFGLIAFLVYFVACVAETNRTPFDIPEAESELTGGYHTEYSGIRFAFFFMAEYANMFLVSAIASTLFLGGWLPPYPGWILNGAVGAVIEGLFWFLGKSFFLMLVMMWLRWTLPRYRVDQVMYLCWKVLVPFAFISLLGIAIWVS
jgi:NADH-quinone oxidoreductase subunit H